ncbi:MAG: hypothetical protein AABX64_01650 [Nanoarchaeota archaeon]
MAEKINPFKEQQQSQMTKKQNSRLDREVTISLSPRKFLRGFLLVAMLLAVFYVGRFSVGATACQLPDFSNLMNVFSSDDANPSGLAVAETEAANETTELPAVEELAPVNETAPESSADDADEIVVVSYSKVALSLDEVYKDWKGTWGRTTGIKYTIKNNEIGTIKPHHFTMLVEGYDDIDYTFEVGIASQRVKAGETKSDEAAVRASYNAVTIPDGDLKKVKFSLFLYDAEDKLIASHHRDVNLED